MDSDQSTPQSTTENSDSSDDDINPAASMEAMAMAAQLEQLQKQQTSTPKSEQSRGSGIGANTNIQIISPTTQTVSSPPIALNSMQMTMPQMSKTQSNILVSTNASKRRSQQHSRNNSGPSLQPRLSAGSLNSSRSASFNQQPQVQIQTQQLQMQPMVFNQATTPNSYQIQQAHNAVVQAQQQPIFFNVRWTLFMFFFVLFLLILN